MTVTSLETVSHLSDNLPEKDTLVVEKNYPVSLRRCLEFLIDDFDLQEQRGKDKNKRENKILRRKNS